MIIRSYFFVIGLFSVVLLGCSVQEKTTGHASTYSSAADIDYIIIYLLHGDADYLYHNEEGRPLQADEEVLKQARSVAENAENGEVFIFHQRPEQKIFWLFPKKDRLMYHYQNGELVNSIRYSPEKDNTFATESNLYKAHRSADDSDKLLKRILLYYGHEIPTQPQTGYHQSRPVVLFGSSVFTDGIAQFKLSDSNPLDLVVLSTCNNGTPDMVNHLRNETKYILASPQNLHLSHIDSDSLSLLERDPPIATPDLAGKMADQTLARMGEFIQTGVALSLYDTDAVNDYIGELAVRVSEQKADAKQKAPGKNNMDCKDLLPGKQFLNSGVRVWHKPPEFGRKSGGENHSGWGCVDIKY